MRFKRSLRFVCMLLFAAMAMIAYAQETDENWYYNKPIVSIVFNGLNNVKALDLDGITGPYIGKMFTDEIYSEIVNKIYGLEYFDDITPMAIPADPSKQTVSLKFDVVERPIISQIKFDGQKQIRSTELRDAISIKTNDIYVENKVLADVRVIRDTYLKKGYTNIKVSSKTEQADKGMTVIFVIDEGKSTVISTINFQGVQVVAPKTLKNELSLKEVSLFNKGAFQEAMLEQDKQVITAYYQARGYIDVSITDVIRDTVFNEDKNRDEMSITFVIQEGTQYTFTGIEISGNAIFTTEQLRDLVSLKDGAVFNQTKYQQGVTAIADLYFENGYTSNGFSQNENKDVEKGTVSYDLTIVERDRSHIENIIIRGNQKTKDYVILRELAIEEGDIYSKAKIQKGYRNLYNLQFFSAIVPDIVAGSEDNLIDVIINVEEQSTTSVEFGVTFSGVESAEDWPFSFFVKWQESNFLGQGKTVSLNTTLATDTQTFSAGYSDSWLFGEPISVSVSANVTRTASTTLQKIYSPSGINSNSYYMNYDNWSIGLSESLGRRWNPSFGILTVTGGLSSNLIHNIFDSDLFVPVDSTVLAYQQKWALQNTVWTSLSVDDRDINYDPSTGWFSSQRFSWTGLVPSVETEFYLRSDTKAEVYFTLLDLPVSDIWNLKFVLAGYSGLSFLVPGTNSPIATSSKLAIDGMFNGRGWSSVYSNKGNAMWSSYLELRWPLAQGILAVDWFFDAITVKDNLGALFTDLSMDDMYFSFGPGIRCSLPQFPLRLMFANTFQIIDGNVKWRVNDKPEWQFVLSFCITNK